jgi:glycosyltransferase involved in cell wall biosynthesis
MTTRAGTTKIVFMSTFPPTNCGIATFTEDLMQGLTDKFSGGFTFTNCELTPHPLSSRAEYSLNPNDREAYTSLAKLINKDAAVALIHIQHEFGLFGGEYGSYILDFLVHIQKPVVITFHSVIPEPDNSLRTVVQQLAGFTTAIFVMTKRSQAILETAYQINKEKIKLTPHGTHLVKWADADDIKEKNGYKNRKLLATFGLLSSGKGIETALKALPEIIQAFPETLYLVIGKTHPNSIINKKDTYREFLEQTVLDLKLSEHVVFINSYLELPKILELLQATDIYLFTSKDPNQAVSGTFAYAMSCACPIIATAIPHTKEVLSEQFGYIIDIDDSKQLAVKTIALLSNKKERDQMALNAFSYTSETSWENIAIGHAKVYDQIVKNPKQLSYDLPPVKLDHLKYLTTERGIIQFSKLCIPDISSGYTLDDNARALIALCMHYELFREAEVLPYIRNYLSFIERCQTPQGTFINYIDEYDHVHIKNDYVNLEDSNARAVWALGTVTYYQDILPDDVYSKALKCLLKCSQWTKSILSPRAIGFAIKGLYMYHISHPEDDVSRTIEVLASNLISRYDLTTEKDWKWFEAYLTYANSILPEALLYAYMVTGKESYKNTALESLEFLISKVFVDGKLRVISNRGWHQKGTPPGLYGEQPIDAFCMIHTLELFYTTFKSAPYKLLMDTAFSWFLGNNQLSQIIYNPLTGGCRDGIEEHNVNLNQGAESTICYLLARLIMEQNHHQVDLDKLVSRNLKSKYSTANKKNLSSKTIKIKT